MSLQDNIEHTEILPDEPDNIDDAQSVPEDASVDEYLKRFDVVAKLHEEMQPNIDNLLKAPFDEHRITYLIKIILQQQKINDETYSILVDMNNLFVDRK